MLKAKVRSKSGERLSRLCEQEGFEVGDRVRVRVSVCQSNLGEEVREGSKKYVVVCFSPEIYQTESVEPVSPGQLGCPLYYLGDSRGRVTRYKKQRVRPSNSGEVQKVGSETPDNNRTTDLTRASFLGKNQSGEDLFYEPPVGQEPVQAPVRTPVVRSPKSGRDWTNFFKRRTVYRQ